MNKKEADKEESQREMSFGLTESQQKQDASPEKNDSSFKDSLVQKKFEDSSGGDEITELFSAENYDGEGCEEIDVSTGTFGGKNNLELKLKEGGQRGIKSAAVKGTRPPAVRARRPISGISGISERECMITDSKQTESGFDVNDERDDDREDI